MSQPEFQSFGKIGRLSRNIIISEKIDGTNAQIFITDDNEMHIGSRNRWITRDDDNYGFANWCHEHKDGLLALGPGRHFGEWWGAGIQRRYGMAQKKFSLFNAKRWADGSGRPECCDVVPILYEGPFESSNIDATLANLIATGSVAAPGFMDPEGIIVFHQATGTLFKKLVHNDELHKGEIAA